MKILFLDFDGVLNSLDDSLEAESRELTDEERTQLASAPSKLFKEKIHQIEPFGAENFKFLIPSKISLLNQVFTQIQDLKIIISSSWRRYYYQSELQWMLNAKGFIGEIISCTPIKMSLYGRGNEIAMWLDNNRYEKEFAVDSFVILDDDPSAIITNEKLLPRFVQTNAVDGLTKVEVEKIIRLFRNESKSTNRADSDQNPQTSS